MQKYFAYFFGLFVILPLSALLLLSAAPLKILAATTSGAVIDGDINLAISSLLVITALFLFAIIFFVGSFPGTWKNLKKQNNSDSGLKLFFKTSGIVFLKIIFLLAMFLTFGWIFSYVEGDLFTFVVFIFVVFFGSVLERSSSWWAGGVIGYFIGMMIGLSKGFFWTGILSMVGLGVFGLLIDYLFSKRIVK